MKKKGILYKKDLVIVTPVYNTGLYIEQFLESILRQKFTNFDIYLVDDGSTDDSYEIIMNYARIDNRIHALKKENGGVSSARNFALDVIKNSCLSYKYIYFCDSDDILGEEVLFKVITNMELNINVDYALFSVAYLYKNKISSVATKAEKCLTLTHKDIVSQYYRQGVRWRKNSTSEGFLNNKIFAFDKAIKYRFDEKLKRAEDFDYFITIHPELHFGIVVPNAYYYYRKRKSSLTSTIKETGDLEVFLKHLNDIEERTDLEKRCLQHKFLRAIYTGVCNSICSRNYQRAKNLIDIRNEIGIKYLPFISDLKMLFVLKLPINLLMIFVLFRGDRATKNNNNYYE